MSYKDFFKLQPVLNKNQKKKKKKILSTEVAQVDLGAIKNVADLVESFKHSSIQARNVGLCANIFEKMLTDKERPTIMLGLACAGSPGSRARCLHACTGSRTARGLPGLAMASWTVLPSERGTTSAPRMSEISRLNTWPTCSPVNASPAPLRAPAHDSGPAWLARPSLYGSLIRCIPTGLSRR